MVGFARATNRWILAIVLAVAGPFSLAASAQKPAPPPKEDPEVELGRVNAMENDKSVKLITDAKLLERVNRIGQEIANAANTVQVPAIWGTPEIKKFNYTFKIVDEKDVNAYSLPGGFIYVNKGTLSYCKSDDELAGVLAHECAHAAHHHMMKLIREQNKMQPYLAVLLLAAALGGGGKNGGDIGALAMAGQLYMVAKLNGYGVEAEKDADQTGLRYLTKTKYNPVGLLTFMERLARDESRGPERILGIYRTHPPSPERAKALLTQLDSLDIPVNRRLTDPTLASRVATVTVNGVPMAEVAVDKTIVARFTASSGATADERARKFADGFDQAMDHDLQMFEVRITFDKAGIITQGHLLATFTPEDAQAQKSTVEALAQNAAEAIRNLIWQAQFNRVSANIINTP